MNRDHSSSFPLVREQAMGEKELEETAEGAGQFCCTLFEDPCWNFIRPCGLSWVQVAQDVPDVFGFEVNIAKIR